MSWLLLSLPRFLPRQTLYSSVESDRASTLQANSGILNESALIRNSLTNQRNMVSNYTALGISSRSCAPWLRWSIIDWASLTFSLCCWYPEWAWSGIDAIESRISRILFRLPLPRRNKFEEASAAAFRNSWRSLSREKRLRKVARHATMMAEIGGVSLKSGSAWGLRTDESLDCAPHV